MPNNVFHKLNDKYLDKEFEVPPGIEQKVLQQANTLGTFGKVVELYIPNALGAVLDIIGSNTRSDNMPDSNSERPDLMTDWRKPVKDLPQAPKDGIIGRFRPPSGERF